jgi:peptidoglycan/xylan/chitin deacetylase (PgdA/CDA1 family)
MERGASVVLLYHRVADERVDPLGMCVSPARFEQHLEVLERVAPVVPASSVATCAAGSVAITFDDGYADVFTEALPRMIARRMPATVFLVGGTVEHFWWDRLAAAVFAGEGGALTRRLKMRVLFPRLRAMDEARRARVIAGLERDGRGAVTRASLPSVGTFADARATPRDLVEVGSHTRSHPALSGIDDRRRHDEITGSKHLLEEELGFEVRTFAYPYGARRSFDDASVKAVQEAGYACAFTNIPGSLGRDRDAFRIPRRVVGNWTGEGFEKRLRRWLGHW